MTALAYWIQRADFSVRDFPPVDLAGAVRAFHDYDWAFELRRQDARSNTGEEDCSAGIGFVGDGRLLHIVPTDEHHALVHYDFTKERRVLGLFPRTVHVVQTAQRFPLTRIPEVLERFYLDDHDWLCQHVR
jgi:hypothetical protein